ncbi:MAG TPA: GNAT family N-acetyltransferase [Steroidobacteraceae bacterium]|jgi:putative acetyltransferase|nr:GNAT family N-acetyltransferase [Steroidobacteraceae bacterium]
MTPPNRLQIRLIEPADVPALLDIIADSRTEPLEPADHELYATYQRQRSLYFVAVLDGKVVGGAGVAPLAGADPLTCELQRVYLHPGARFRGVGNALLEQCFKAAKQFLYVRCYLDAATQMHEALEFYGRHGFRDLTSPLGKSGRGHNDRWMVRPLRASAREWNHVASAR